ncbi:MAG: hypothetical protein EOO88_57915 [Pedobacter sp.]|nr:MAG: hypothetical protein EOO88_57915 [Pedobacter sp.]
MTDDTTHNPEADTFQYIRLVVESLNKMNRLDLAVNTIEQRLPVELFKVVDKSNNGILGFITDSQPGKYLAIEYDGMLINNKDDFDSEDAKMLNGATETYTLTEDAGVTRLDITSDMTEEYYEMMSAQWDIALQKIKALAETK